MSLFKDKLKEANRYDEVLKILVDIVANKNKRSYPVDPYVKDGKIKMDIYGEDLALEASKFLLSLLDGTIDTMRFEDFYNNLYRYIENITCSKLHNYAVTVSHRKDPDEKLMEEIRCYLIINNYLRCMNIDRVNDPDFRGTEWKIPDGWKKKDE